MAAEHVHRLSRQLLLTWRWLLNNRSLSAWTDLQRSDIELWMTARLAEGIVPSSLRTMLCDLLTFLRFAIDQALPVSSQLLRVAYPQTPAPLPLALSDQDYLALVKTVLAETATLTPDHLQERAWFLTLAHTGVRVSELLNLRLNDLDLRGRRLYIRNPKNGQERVLFMTPSLHHSLVAYLTQLPASADNHLWLHAASPLKAHQVRYRLCAWGKLSQVHVSPHLLRHTLATRLVNQGMPLLSVSKLLGHDSLHATQRYAHLYDSTVHDHFQAAVSHIEGIPVPDWPASTTHFVTLLADSV